MLLLLTARPMADLDLFRSFFGRVTQTTPYKSWKSTKAGARDAVKFEAYAKSVIEGSPSARPAVETTYGNAMLDAAQMGANG